MHLLRPSVVGLLCCTLSVPAFADSIKDDAIDAFYNDESGAVQAFKNVCGDIEVTVDFDGMEGHGEDGLEWSESLYMADRILSGGNGLGKGLAAGCTIVDHGDTQEMFQQFFDKISIVWVAEMDPYTRGIGPAQETLFKPVFTVNGKTLEVGLRDYPADKMVSMSVWTEEWIRSKFDNGVCDMNFFEMQGSINPWNDYHEDLLYAEEKCGKKFTLEIDWATFAVYQKDYIEYHNLTYGAWFTMKDAHSYCASVAKDIGGMCGSGDMSLSDKVDTIRCYQPGPDLNGPNWWEMSLTGRTIVAGFGKDSASNGFDSEGIAESNIVLRDMSQCYVLGDSIYYEAGEGPEEDPTDNPDGNTDDESDGNTNEEPNGNTDGDPIVNCEGNDCRSTPPSQEDAIVAPQGCQLSQTSSGGFLSTLWLMLALWVRRRRECL